MVTINADVSTFGDDILRGKIDTDARSGTTTLNSPDNFIYDYIFNYGDTIYGKSGNDRIIGDRYDTAGQQIANDYLYGEDGDDVIYGDTGPEDANFATTIFTGSGNKLVGGRGKDTIYGGGGSSGDYIYGDMESTGAGAAGDSSDKLYGYGGNDYIYGGGGNDYINGGADNDGNLRGGLGNDTMRGGLGNDNLYGGAGSDYFYGDDGDDYIDGDSEVSHNTEVDVLSYIEAAFYVTVDLAITSGQATNAGGFDTIRNIEKLVGTNFGDRLYGSIADETIEGRDGIDEIRGNQGKDRLSGGKGNDKVTAGDGNDTLYGGDGDDKLYGEIGNDKLVGDAGKDLIYGGAGKDTMSGGLGKDTFYFKNSLSSANVDKITDFKVVDDTIKLSKSIFKALGSTVTSDEFYKGSGAHDNSDHIIYNKSTGALIYDANGDSSGKSYVFGYISTGLSLTYKDFLME